MLRFIKTFVKITTNCYKMFHLMETNPLSKSLLLANISSC